MGTLTKTIGVNYTPATPGSPGSPGAPAVPPYWTRTCSKARLATCVPFYYTTRTMWLHAIGDYAVFYRVAYLCEQAVTETRSLTKPQGQPDPTCYIQYHGATAEIPPIAPVAPTPAQTAVLFYPGWNASGMSIPGVIAGKGAAFTVTNGSMGVLVCLAPDTWTPNIATAQFGIMFQAGGFPGQPSSVTAMVWENGAPVQPLGTFINGQTFVIGRSLDNRIVYWNQTQGIMVTRPKSVLPLPIKPMRLVAQFYYGGDACAA